MDEGAPPPPPRPSSIHVAAASLLLSPPSHTRKTVWEKEEGGERAYDRRKKGERIFWATHSFDLSLWPLRQICHLAIGIWGGEEIYSGKAILCLPPSPLSVFLLLSGTTLQDKRTEAESRKYPFSLPIPSSPPMWTDSDTLPPPLTVGGERRSFSQCFQRNLQSSFGIIAFWLKTFSRFLSFFAIWCCCKTCLLVVLPSIPIQMASSSSPVCRIRTYDAILFSPPPPSV